jgi:predicted metal-dependent peptidase
LATQGTATDIPISSSISDEEAAKFRLDPHLINLMLSEPFFSHILRGIHKVKTNSIPTAGVAVREQNPTLFWNPKFLGGLLSKKVGGVMKHECYHLIFKHCTSRKKDPHMLWNWATDLAINSLIDYDELPEEGLFPGRPLNLSKVEDPALLEKWKKVSDLIESLPPKQTSEWYFKMLKEDKEVSDTIEGGGEFALGDDHGEWGEMSDEDRQIVEGKLKKALGEAVKKCDSSGNWGSVSAEAREQLRKMVSNQVDWKKVLHTFCGRSQRMNKSHTMRRINRKYPYIHAGTKRGHTASIAVYMDQSGSVGDEDVAMLFAELNNLGRKVSFTLYPFDTQVKEDKAVKWTRGKKVPPVRNYYGGTSFDAVAKHAEKNRDKFDGYIILTDGEASDPGPSRLRRAWVIVPNRKLLFNAHPGDLLIQMDRETNAP